MIFKNFSNYKNYFIYLSILVFISLVFVLVLYPPISKSFFVLDCWWLVPYVYQTTTKNLSFIQWIRFILDLRPVILGVASVKTYNLFVLSIFGPDNKYFVLVSVLFHFINAALIFTLSKKLRLDFKIGYLASLIYLTLFAHFEAYLWPMAFQEGMLNLVEI
jgi:hypothetical protein